MQGSGVATATASASTCAPFGLVVLSAGRVRSMRTDRCVFVLAGLPVGRPFAPLGCYQISRRSDIGVLPEAQNGPTEVVEMLVGLPVALDVADQLGRPPFLVRHGVCRVRGAPVPEAT